MPRYSLPDPRFPRQRSRCFGFGPSPTAPVGRRSAVFHNGTQRLGPIRKSGSASWPALRGCCPECARRDFDFPRMCCSAIEKIPFLIAPFLKWMRVRVDRSLVFRPPRFFPQISPTKPNNGDDDGEDRNCLADSAAPGVYQYIVKKRTRGTKQL